MSARPPSGPGDRDFDEGKGEYFDKDDATIRDFGHPLQATALRQIGSSLSRYYAAAAAGDGATACSLLYSPFAESIVEDHGEEGAGTKAAGGSCSAILAKVFGRNRSQLRRQQGRTRMISARVQGRRGFAVFDTGLGRPLVMFIHAESGIWKLESMVAQEFG